MKLTIKDATNKAVGSTTAPVQFSEPYRPDLIIRAVRSLQSRARQPYGAKPGAGQRASAELSRRRRKYRGSYGFGISRVPRKILTRRGTRMYWVGAVAPGTVGGRRAHPPKAEKKWEEKINKKENRKAIRSAMSATLDKALVRARGHQTPDDYPFIISTKFEEVSKTSDVITALVALGLADELDRASIKKIRAGKGTLRGRKYKRRTGPLVVVGSRDAPLMKAAKNVPGIDIVPVEMLNTELLAPGTHPGRLTLYTESAIKRLADEKLFMLAYKAPAKEEKKPKTKKSVKAKSAKDNKASKKMEAAA